MEFRITSAAAVVLLVWSAAPAQEPLKMHVVPIPVKSYRLLSMSMDDDGYIWAGAIHRVIHRYDPRTGTVENIPLPYPSSACSCICAGEKVYVLGQTYPKLIIYHRATGKFRQVDYPSPKPNVWYGTELIQGRYIYLFDRGVSGVIKWDTQTDTGIAIRYPYQTPLPLGGQYVARDGAVWCKVWDLARIAQYIPLGIARLDVAKDKFTGWWEFPDNDADLKPFEDPSDTLFLPWSLKGKIRPFDFTKQRWCTFLTIPRHGELFAFIGGPWIHKGRRYFSMSTYDGDAVGCDGKPYHFCNAVLEFDPQTRKFRFPTLRVDENSYYQISYSLSAGGEFFATGSNIREPDGTLNGSRTGEVVFWQTVKPDARRTNK